eukprot:TRINITY_DN25958_c0_g1_i1.p1 TRINITY_DN25958_c0_g1~~TRINITY_DN25958_c0_g1_i1.p1  ORF type:complete len:144 (+),score=23.61 TRINITY_DN25958_c0_g1_i1:83-514(+)
MLMRSLSSQFPVISPLHLRRRIFAFDGDDDNVRRARSYIRAIDKESQPFEFDPAKARDALQELDEQLQTLSQKQIVAPKKRNSSSSYSEPDAQKDPMIRRMMTEELPEFSGSYFAYSASALLIFTIFYNIVFNLVIKPAVDGE